MPQVIQSGIASLKSRVTPYLPVDDLVFCSSKAAAGLHVLRRTGHPNTFQGTEKVQKKIWGERMARLCHFILLFLSVLLFHMRGFFFVFLFHCPALYLCKSFSVRYLLYGSYRPVIARILPGSCDCLPGGFFSVGTFRNLSVSLHGSKACTQLLGSSIAYGVVMTTCCEGSQQG